LATDHPMKKARECDERFKFNLRCNDEFERDGGQMQSPREGFLIRVSTGPIEVVV